MPRKPKKEEIVCAHYRWLLGRRGGVWTAGGRGSVPGLGRHSLGTKDRDEALRQLARLDLVKAVEHGRADPSALAAGGPDPLPLAEGRDLYLAHAGRPRVTGGVRASSLRRYRPVLDKFAAFARGRGLSNWNQVTAATLEAYAADLEERGVAEKTLAFELTTLLQAVGRFVEDGRLPAGFKVATTVRKPEGTDAHCWTPEEVLALCKHCCRTPGLAWLRDALLALALTGMRVGELAGLRREDVDLGAGIVTLVDESASGKPRRAGRTARTLKGGRGRAFPVHDELRPTLEALARQPYADGYVFRGPGGSRVTDRHVRAGLKAAQAALAERFSTPAGGRGFGNGTPHSFRHFFCSLCANAGVPERTAMTWFGHRDRAMVRNYYHLHDAEARRHLRRLSRGGPEGE